jgi:hypothetical protein
MAMGEMAFKQTVAFDYEGKAGLSDGMRLRLLQFKKVSVLQKGSAATVYHCIETKGEADARRVAVKVTSKDCREEAYELVGHRLISYDTPSPSDWSHTPSSLAD